MPKNPPPPRLYKYQPFTPHTLANLKSTQIWFNAPTRFNDPFDCALPLYDPSHLTDAGFLRVYEHEKQRHPMTPELEAALGPNGVPSPVFRDMILNAVQDTITKLRKTLLEERGVACFSEKPLDIMMWSHYADGHRGFCLEFDTSYVPWVSKTFQVRYSDKFPYINPVDIIVEPAGADPENPLLVASVLTKALCWQDEHEWRTMHQDPNKLFGYDWRALTGIYFGAAMPPAHKEILCLILHGSPTHLYNVERDPKGFALNATKVNYKPYDWT